MNLKQLQINIRRLRAPAVSGLILVSLVLSCIVQAHTPATATELNLSGVLSLQDETRSNAEKLYTEGRNLAALGTSESMTEAIKKFQQSLSLWRKLGDRRAEASTLSFIAKIHDTLGEKQQALDLYNQTLPMFREAKDPVSEARTLNNIGLIYDAFGDKRRALEFYNRALPVLTGAGDRLSEGTTLVNIGLAYVNLGEPQKALNYYQRALVLFREVGDRATEAVTLNNIGLAYNGLGEKQIALEYFGQALPILKSISDSRVEAITLNNIGYVYDSLDEKQKALEYYQRALPVLRRAGDRFKEAVTLNNIGLVYHSLSQIEKSLEYFTQALNLRKAIGDRPGEAVSLSDVGAAYDSLGQPDKAVGFYNDSLRLSRTVEDRETEASTLRRIAIVESKRGNLMQARARIEEAIAIIEALRVRITGPELRATYFASAHKYFETYIGILMQQHRNEPSKGHDAVALQANEQARARTMLEMLVEAHADIREGISPTLLDRERRLQQELRIASEALLRPSTIASNAETTVLKFRVERLLNEYQQVKTEIKSASPRYAALTQPVPLDLNAIQSQTLDNDTLLLEYSLGEEKSYLWAVTSSSLKSFELPRRAEIEKSAREVYQLLTSRNQQIKFETAAEKSLRIEKADKAFVEAASRLSQMLLGPVAGLLGSSRLLIVGDGVLDYVPFAALPIVDGKSGGKYQPLIVEHEVVALPSASTLASLRREIAGRKPADRTLAVIADPVFDKNDGRVTLRKNDKAPSTRSAISFNETRPIMEASLPQTTSISQTGPPIQRLPFTRLEADEILALVPASESKKAVDFDANRDTATSLDLGGYRYIHFATHGILNSQYAELSGLVLSLVNRDGSARDGFLWAHEVFNLHLPVELVVLSGCRTGLGKEIRGEGLVGLTRGFMYAGASRVVVSLWDISDEASAELMAQFYRNLLGQQRMSPAAALRAAQIAIWKDRRWQAPYYWAAFVIQGESR